MTCWLKCYPALTENNNPGSFYAELNLMILTLQRMYSRVAQKLYFSWNFFLIYAILAKKQVQFDKVKHNFQWIIWYIFPVIFY